MKIKAILPFLSLFLFVCAVNAQTSGSRVPYTIHDNFDTGEMFTWEPYPYQQDTGYDPLFGTKKEPAYGGKGSSLSRLTKPNDANDLSQGFTKRIDMYTLPNTKLKFAYYFMSDRKPEKLDVSLGTFDGRLFTHTILSPKANTWVEVEIPVELFKTNDGKSLSDGNHLQVVVMKAFYPLVNHLPSYSMLMDEFMLNGERSRQFIAQSQKSTWFEQFGHAVLNRHYANGDIISLNILPEDGVKLNVVTAELISPDNKTLLNNIKFYDDGTHGDFKALDGIWSNKAVYTIKATDQRGQWKLRVTGNGNAQFSWDLGFIVPVSGLTQGVHPRVFYSESQLLARMAGPEPEPAKRLLNNFIKSYKPSTTDINKLVFPSMAAPESVTGGPYASAGMGGWYNTQNSLAKVITSEAWQYALTKNKDAAERAKAALLKLSKLPSWNHPWMEANGNHTYYPGAPAAFAAGIGYDILFSLLSADEQKTVRKGIMENSIKPFYRDMVELNRMPSSNSNHIGVILSGVGIAAMAIANDDPNLPGLEPYLSGILAKTRQFIDRTMLPEGSYNEPYTYQEMGYRELVEFLYSLERNFGVDYTSTSNLKEFYQYPIYVTQAKDGAYQDLGDVSHTYNFTQQPMQWLVYKLKDPFMYKYVKPSWDSGKARGGIIPYLWYTEGIIPIGRETLPLSKHFEGKGHMVTRTSWEDSGTVMIFKAGPNGNHYHTDQGTILLTHNGEELLSDAGHSSDYYGNLYFPGYYTQAIGHNVMLVDMNAESQAVGDFENGIAALRTHPEITQSFAGNNAMAAVGDLTNVYKNKVSKYTRTLLSSKSGPVFLFDQVKSAEAHAFNWIFHAEHTNGKSSISYSDNRMTINRLSARLTMDILSPQALTGRIRNSDRDESFIAISSEKMKDADFLAVLQPESMPSNAGYATRLKPKRIDSNGWIGAMLNEANSIHYGFFRINDSSDSGVEGFKTDASKFSALLTDNKLKEAYFDGKTFEGYGSGLKFSAPVAASLAISSSETVLELKSDSPVDLFMIFGLKPKSIIHNGMSVKNWKYDPNSKILALTIPKGQSKITIN
jgi:hypothetical protein